MVTLAKSHLVDLGRMQQTWKVGARFWSHCHFKQLWVLHLQQFTLLFFIMQYYKEWFLLYLVLPMEGMANQSLH